MKTITAAFLTLALAVLFVQAAPTILETRENNRPARRDIGWDSFPEVTEINDDKGPGRRRRRDLGWDSTAGTFAKPQDSGWNKKREDVGWNAEPNKPQDSGWGP